MWNCKPNERVLLSSNYDNFVLLAMSDYWVRLFHVTPSGFTVVATAQFQSEVSAIKIFRIRDGSVDGGLSVLGHEIIWIFKFQCQGKECKIDSN